MSGTVNIGVELPFKDCDIILRTEVKICQRVATIMTIVYFGPDKEKPLLYETKVTCEELFRAGMEFKSRSQCPYQATNDHLGALSFISGFLQGYVGKRKGA